jgi:hypothetical protein
MKILTISSKRKYDLCPREWSYRNVLNLEPKDISAPIIRGNELHEGAEGTYGDDSDKVTTSKQTAYDRWAKNHDDIKPYLTEIPLVVPLNSLREYCDLTPIGHYGGWYYGGVADVLCQSPDTRLWLLDHKSVTRFYPVPAVYSLEQIGMYCVALELTAKTSLTGGIISRVKQLESTRGDHVLNHTLKALSKDGIELTKGFIRLITKSERRTGHQKSHSDGDVRKSNTRQIPPSYNKSPLSNNTVQEQVQELGTRTNTTRIRLTDNKIQVHVTRYSPEGYLTESIRNVRGGLVHVQRHYYPLTRVEKEQIVRDFLAFADEVIEGDLGRLARRSPGLHCNQCSYLSACASERARGLVLGSCIDPEDFQTLEPNQELIRRLKVDPGAS